MRFGPLFVALFIASACLVVFLLESRGYVGEEELGVKTEAIVAEPWRLLTFMFTHDGVSHLAMNLSALVLAGLLALELGIRGSTFLAVFLIVGVLAIAPFLLVEGSYNLVGASAGICGLFGAVTVEFGRYGFSSLGIFLLFLLGIIAAPALEVLGGSPGSAVEVFVHSFALILGAGLIFSFRGALEPASFPRDFLVSSGVRKNRGH